MFRTLSTRLLSFQKVGTGKLGKRSIEWGSRMRLNSTNTSRAELNKYPGDIRSDRLKKKNVDTFLYASSMVISFIGISYAAVPLYRLLCKTTGFGGVPNTDIKERSEKDFQRIPGFRNLRIKFVSQVSSMLNWSFIPEIRFINTVPGETNLTFYKALNKSEKPIIGVATYNIVPDKAAAYFNKIQCFCFDEQKLDPHEEVDMPVFFFIDPEFANDPLMDDVNEITLSYTFFKAAGRD
ncbi:Cytochrome c oxidase assembly protein COX11, mitochondrial [Smittium mucronatum]|uniref:Cytochrome c oxidase assembly protein COX11, mitochondrial n=1 Tax=Smittium mucronatum TaxID=133383 RepID=A0A1R0H611_9FUNG|nr:Cytochrome c oxidase assembly protein COX11, mitochondrial [Smittium mucronatum]